MAVDSAHGACSVPGYPGTRANSNQFKRNKSSGNISNSFELNWPATIQVSQPCPLETADSELTMMRKESPNSAAGAGRPGYPGTAAATKGAEAGLQRYPRNAILLLLAYHVRLLKLGLKVTARAKQLCPKVGRDFDQFGSKSPAQPWLYRIDQNVYPVVRSTLDSCPSRRGHGTRTKFQQ
eukprot:3115736-Rhodomonas_salina.1